MARHPLSTRRAYDEPTASDGRRIIVDRLWPRGLAKDKRRYLDALTATRDLEHSQAEALASRLRPKAGR